LNKEIKIGNHVITENGPVYIVAEMSANHKMDLNRAKEIVDAAADAGADAVKLQTYTPDTITMNGSAEYFQARGLWKGQTLYELYQKAYTPWEWHEELMQHAKARGIGCFSSPFDLTAIDFLEKLEVPAYKVASFEINDIPFIKKIAKTGKPVIISTGIAYLEDIDLALRTCRQEQNENVILLKCVSAYPAPYENMNLKVISNMGQTFGCITGLSDHSLGDETAIAGVALGAKMVEKHLTLKRSDGGPDAAFSMEPEEFGQMVRKIRNTERALGRVTYELNEEQVKSRKNSRSLFVAQDMKKGDVFSESNLKSIRPGIGMHTKYYENVLGQRARCDIPKGTPMEWKYAE
jgi:pseudaminic acid synthase